MKRVKDLLYALVYSAVVAMGISLGLAAITAILEVLK